MLFQEFIPRLKSHLLGRFLKTRFDSNETVFSESERNTVQIIGDRIYSAKIFCVNYTTYDLRCDQDSMNPCTHCNVMVISPEDEPNAHPFWYAWVLGVFHVNVLHTGARSSNHSIQHVEFLWVRWFGIEPKYRSGSSIAQLPKIGFVPDSDDSAFGFLDPFFFFFLFHHFITRPYIIHVSRTYGRANK
jgi:hypothetical protein